MVQVDENKMEDLEVNNREDVETGVTITSEGNKMDEDSGDAVLHLEENISDVEGTTEEMQKESVMKSPTYCDIVRSESGKDNQRKPDMVNVIRPSLPRSSKTYHKFVPENSVPGNQGRKVSRKGSH